MRLRYHEDRRFYKPESACSSSLYGEKRVTDVTKETGYITYDSLDFFSFPKDRYIC